MSEPVGRYLGIVTRSDGTVVDITYALERGRRTQVATDFRTTDDEPLVMGPRDRLVLTLARWLPCT